MEKPPKMEVIYATPPEQLSKEVLIQVLFGMTWDEWIDYICRNRDQFRKEAREE